MRKQITYRTKNYRYIFLVFSVLIPLSYGLDMIKTADSILGINFYQIVTPLVISIALIGVFKLLKKGTCYEFDNTYLYKVSDTEFEFKVNLKDIVSIERPIIQWGSVTNNRVIKYRTSDGEIAILKLRISGNGNFRSLMNVVRSANKKVKIKGFLFES